jgi:hypothetical protein
MKSLIKKALYTLSPKMATSLFSARARAHSHRIASSWGNDRVVAKLVAEFGNVVQAGPFAGLLLPPMAHAEQMGPYLLGTYESELNDAWKAILQSTYHQIVDIGSKFGYYAVGLARKYPDARVVAFDTDPWARRATAQMTELNGLLNVTIENYCSSDWLVRHVEDNALIISDCEGFEAILFSAKTIQKLHMATLLIEAHDCYVPGISHRLKDAFGLSHDVRIFTSERERLRPLRLPPGLSPEEIRLATLEVRGETPWLLCVPRARN